MVGGDEKVFHSKTFLFFLFSTFFEREMFIYEKENKMKSSSFYNAHSQLTLILNNSIELGKLKMSFVAIYNFTLNLKYDIYTFWKFHLNSFSLSKIFLCLFQNYHLQCF